ncbi:MAG: hypothetical protein DI635_14865 [Pseudoxanthomonas suwonensis]|nr:MAG: hypothetical protein DI635_14865 [Pseudoxanthomonas suwonensis]
MSPLAPGWDVGATLADTKERQARYGVMYVATVCAQFGVAFTETPADSDRLAVDGTLDFETGGVRIQVKCTTKDFTNMKRGPWIRWPISESWASKWRKNSNPVYLVVVRVPHDPSMWLDFDADHKTLHEAAAYWLRVDNIATPSPKSVYVPFDQRFTAATVRDWNRELEARYLNGGGDDGGNGTP